MKKEEDKKQETVEEDGRGNMDEEKPKRRRRKKHSLLFPYRQNTIYLCRGHTAVFRSENTIHTLLKEKFKKCNYSNFLERFF